jgi:hypothetical protein
VIPPRPNSYKRVTQTKCCGRQQSTIKYSNKKGRTKSKSAALRMSTTINQSRVNHKDEPRRTYNYKAKKDADYEPVTRDFLLK